MRGNSWVMFFTVLAMTAAVAFGLHFHHHHAKIERDAEAAFEKKCQESKERIDDLQGCIRTERWMIQTDETQVSTVALGPDPEFTAAYRADIRGRKAKVTRWEGELDDEQRRFSQLTTAFKTRFGRPPVVAVHK